MTQEGGSASEQILDENRIRQFMREVIRFCSHIPNLSPEASHALAYMKAIEGRMEVPASRIRASFKLECTTCYKGFDIPGTDIDPDSDRTLFCPFCGNMTVTEWSNEL